MTLASAVYGALQKRMLSRDHHRKKVPIITTHDFRRADNYGAGEDAGLTTLVERMPGTLMLPYL